MDNLTKTAVIDGMTVHFEEEKNLLELVRKANVDLPTFCYHSDISVYGACRMCMVEVEGRGIVPACSTPVTDGMVVKTSTKQLRDMRKMVVELMLASHENNCTTCPKSGECKLQKISRRMGITKVRFKQMKAEEEIDLSSDSILRDPAKCVLCGDCVRVCNEIQSVGVLDFVNRGANSRVKTFCNHPMGKVECVNCGQCVKVCPVGALMPKFNMNEVWDAIHDPEITVVAQIAPAVRVAIGEYFGQKPGVINTGKIVSALRMMGFDQIYDTSFGADLTVVEEGREFLRRYEKGENLPQFTSCCPAWVKFAEQYYPDMIGNLSTCRSPQQMFGSLCKEYLEKTANLKREKIVVVSIMPCTAKKFEANRDEFQVDGNRDVDFVLTTKELSLMIKERGIEFDRLEPGSFDLPFGFKTGAGVIFGSSGGVSEAVLRYASGKVNSGAAGEFKQVRGSDGIRKTEITVGAHKLKLAIVSGLANARKLIDKIRAGEEQYDLVEVMACCGGCVNGGGQPTGEHAHNTLAERAKGLYSDDKMLLFHNSDENPYLKKIYAEHIDHDTAHRLFHTEYENRRRIAHDDFLLKETEGDKKLTLTVCFGTSCFVRGAQQLYKSLSAYIAEKGLTEVTDFKASFCGKSCKKGPVVNINGNQIEHCTLEKAIAEIEKILG